MANNVEQLSDKRDERRKSAGPILSSRSNNEIVNMIDKTVRETAVDPKSTFNPWNSDDLYQKRSDYSIYEDMVNDDQVNVALNVKKDLIIGSGFHFLVEDSDSEEIREDLEVAFTEDVEKSFEDILMEMMTAYDFGFSVSEKQFKLRNDGSLTLKNIRTRHPVSWLFWQDVHGNIIKYEQQGTTTEFSDINPNALLHFINNPRFENPYGTSDLRAAYTAYFIKRQITKFYAIFLEKAASPIPVAKYDKNIASDEDIQKIHDTIKKFQASTAMTIPKEFEIDFLDAKGTGEVYVKGINMFNMFIGRALFVPDLLGFQGAETTGGSQALGQEQMQVFFKHIWKRRRTLENLINEHLVKPLVRWNFGDVEKFPKFKFNPIDNKQAEQNAKLWLEAIKSPLYKITDEDINHFKKIIDFPETDFDELEDDPIEVAAREAEIETKPEVKEEKKEEFVRIFKPTNGEFAKKTDVKVIENQFNSALEMFIASSKPIINDIYEGLFADLRKAKKPNPETIKLKKPPLKKLKKLLDESMLDMFKRGQEIAQGEIFKLNFAMQTSKEFLRTLESENFNAIGDWEFNVTKAARVEMIAAIKDGLPIQSVIEVLDETGKKALQVSTERYARTKFTEVMNKGRREWFESTGVVAGYQYSAILDDRTTTICRGLHGKKFKSGTEPIPPMHFNCRSLLIPITKFEEFKPDSKAGGKNIDAFIDDEKGKGFSKE